MKRHWFVTLFVVGLLGVVFGEDEFPEYWPAVSAPAKAVMLSARMDGQIMKLFVNEGDPVKKDQVLIQFDDELLQLGAERTKLASEDVSSIKAAELKVQFSKGEYERNEPLYKKGTISEADFRQYETQYHLAVANLETTQVGLKTAQVEYKMRLAMLDYSRVKSPFDGIVARKRIEEGESARNLQELIEVIRTDEIRVKVNLPESLLPQIAKETGARVIFPSLGKDEMEGRIDKIAPVVDARSRTFLVEVLVDNKKGAIQPGLSALVRFIHDKPAAPPSKTGKGKDPEKKAT